MAANQSENGGRDQEYEPGGVDQQCGSAQTLEELVIEKLEEPAVGCPGCSCHRRGERLGAWDGVVGADPLPGAEVPADVGIQDSVGVEAEVSRGEEQHGDDGQVN